MDWSNEFIIHTGWTNIKRPNIFKKVNMHRRQKIAIVIIEWNFRIEKQVWIAIIICMFMYVCRPQGIFFSCSPFFFSFFPSFLLFISEKRFLTETGTHQYGYTVWFAIQRSSCLFLPSAGIIGICCCVCEVEWSRVSADTVVIRVSTLARQEGNSVQHNSVTDLVQTLSMKLDILF